MKLLITGAAFRNPNGQFAKSRSLWTPECWDEGYIDNCGYFRVYRPDCPGAYGNGYAKRAAVVLWLQRGRVRQAGEARHHINGNKTDDRAENLTVIGHGDHTMVHHPKTILVCQSCGQTFALPRGKSSKTRRFCSQDCYHRSPMSLEHRRAIGAGNKKAYAERRR